MQNMHRIGVVSSVLLSGHTLSDAALFGCGVCTPEDYKKYAFKIVVFSFASMFARRRPSKRLGSAFEHICPRTWRGRHAPGLQHAQTAWQGGVWRRICERAHIYIYMYDSIVLFMLHTHTHICVRDTHSLP